MPSTTCGWCGRLSNMTFQNTVVAPLAAPMADARDVMGAYTCDHCQHLTIAYMRNIRDLTTPLESLLHNFASYDGMVNWLPQGTESKAFPDVPDHIASAASEAHECFSIGAHRAAVLLARSVIEAAAKDKGITTGVLASKIDQMFDKHLVREHVRDEAHEVRHLGNDMAHGDFVEPIDKDDAEAVLILMGEIVEEVFQSPAITARLRKRREAKKGHELRDVTGFMVPIGPE
jgi:hypothetical protein